MGPVNWLAVFLATNFATALRIVWYGPLAGRNTLIREAGQPMRRRGWAGMVLLLFLSAAMLGHMFARIQPSKGYLYLMMAGGIALFYVTPALMLAYGRRGIPIGHTVFEAGYWLVAYLAMGATFMGLA